MAPTRSYRAFRIEVRPSPESNDHEVRFFADGEDLITCFWSDMIGLDPDDILVEPCPIRCSDNLHRATIARCNCGVIGCGSVQVDVQRFHDVVEWRSESDSPQTLQFLGTSYDAEVERALQDTSWETRDRTAARLLRMTVDREILAHHGLSYSWASGRIRDEMMSVSLMLEPGPYQILVHVPWIAETPGNIAQKCAEVLAKPPGSWEYAEWFPQQAGLGPPSLAGSAWRRGGI
jgi:hypothetical protein